MIDLLLYDYPTSICSQMARLALVEKGLSFRRRPIDIMDTNEQFEAWYVALNPRAVVPTLQIGDELVTDTIRIVNRVQQFPGPDLSGDSTTQDWLRDIMAPHYGVLMYRKRLDPDGTAPQIVSRGIFLRKLLEERPDLKYLLEARIEGNRRFQALLKNPDGIEHHLANTRELIKKMAAAVADQPFIAGERYSLADCFAAAALARFTVHGLAENWSDTPLAGYYERIKARPSFITAEVVETGTERDL